MLDSRVEGQINWIYIYRHLKSQIQGDRACTHNPNKLKRQGERRRKRFRIGGITAYGLKTYLTQIDTRFGVFDSLQHFDHISFQVSKKDNR